MFEKEVLELKDFDQIEDDRKAMAGLLAEYQAVLKRLAVLYAKYSLYLSDVQRETSFYKDDPGLNVDRVMKVVDANLWQYAINTSHIEKLMTSGDVVKMREQVKEKAPVFSAEMARGLVSNLVANSDKLVMYSVKQVFDKLTAAFFRKGSSWRATKEHRNNNKIEKSFRFSHFWGGFPEYWYEERHTALFNDLEMVCHLVNGLSAPEYPKRLGDRMREGQRSYNPAEREMHFTTPYFEIQLFKNGNVKVDFLCTKTLETLNRWGADGTKLGPGDAFAFG